MSKNNDSLLGTNAPVDPVIDPVIDPAASSQDPAAGASKADPVIGFYDSLDDDLKKHQSLKKFDTKEKIASSYVELESKLGKKFEDLSEDEIIVLNSKFGVPDTAEEYEISDTDGILDAQKLSKAFKELGVPKHLGSKIFDKLKKDIIKDREANEVESVEDFNRRQDETVMALKQEYGVDWDKRVQLANKTIKHQPNGEALYDKLAKAGLSDDIDIVKMFVDIGKGLVEDKLLGEDVGDFGMSPDQASEEIARLLSNPDWINSYSNVSNPGNKEAVAKMEKLHRIKARLISGK